MKIERKFTTAEAGAYGQMAFQLTTSEIRNPDGKVVFRNEAVEVPVGWSQVASDVLAQKYFRKAGIPAVLKRVKEKGVPEFLWRSVADDAALAKLAMVTCGWSVDQATMWSTRVVDSVAQQTDVEGRLIVSCLVGEQIRLFNSDREAYKKWISPLKILSVESMFSFGVTGIKEHTAIQIEEHLKNPKSVYYLGEKYEHLLDFKTANPTQERISRLTDFHNHYYSYLYAAIFLKQVKMQWERAGFPIDHRPEILVTLFNVGYPQSVPKAHPKVGGSTIKIKDKAYTFGAVAYQFYYSGELYDLFPFEKRKFDWEDIALR